jgi:hypothetical protein
MEHPTRVANHFMYEITQAGYNLGVGAQVQQTKGTTPVFCCLNVISFVQEEELFSFRVRLYAVFPNGHSRNVKEGVSLTLDEQKEIQLPEFHWANATEVEVLDEPSVRLVSKQHRFVEICRFVCLKSAN